MDKEHTHYGAGMAVISRAENGYIVTLRLWDSEVTLVSETLDGVVGILRRVDWSGVPRGEPSGKLGLLAPTPVQRVETTRPDEGAGMSARAFRDPH